MQPALRRAEQRVAALVLDDPQSFFRMVLRDAARRAEVSEPTILRFCRSLGCGGFPDFKIRLARCLAVGVPYVHQDVGPDDDVPAILRKIVLSSARTLTALAGKLDAAVIACVADLLRRAPRIECYGVGASGIVALDAQQKLMRLGVPVLAYADAHLQTASAAALRPGDVALCFSHTGAILDTLRAARTAARQGAVVVAITRTASPLAAIATHLIAVDAPEDTEHYAPMASRIAHLAVVDVLATAVAAKADAVTLEVIRRVKNSLLDQRSGTTPLHDARPRNPTAKPSRRSQEMLKRRSLIAGVAGASVYASARAQTPTPAVKELTILAHPVLLSVCKGSRAGDLTEAWRQRTGITVNWVTLETNPLHERLFREASLAQTSIDVAFLVNARAVPRIGGLFEPLDAWMQKQPIESFEDIFPGLRKAMVFDGHTLGVPFRHSTSGLHYNAELFAERGIAGPPATLEEFIEIANKMTYKRADGSQVNGFCISGDSYPNIVDVARTRNGDFIDQDMHVVANQAPMVQAITLLRDFYKAGVLPRSFTSVKDEDVNTWMASGRAAMTFNGLSRTQFYNDPAKSKFPGSFKVAPIPVAAALKSQFEVAPVKTEFWSMVLPKNGQRKEAAWSLVAELSSKENTVKAAINGNGPVRGSAYQDARIQAQLPYAAVEASELRYARIPLPAFDDSAKAADIFVELMQAAVLGMKEPQAAMDEVVRRVQPLVH